MVNMERLIEELEEIKLKIDDLEEKIEIAKARAHSISNL